VTTFTPGKTIVVKRETGGPATYTLGKTVTYTTRGGKTIEASMIKPGVPVHVYYDTPGSTTVTKVVVDQD
jgi:endonuclease YncB( thermonuclease family)